MYPHERSLVEKLKDKPFALIGVNSDTDKKKLKERMEKEKITWRSFWNGPEGTGGPISKKWNVHGWPTIYVLDQDAALAFYRDKLGFEVRADATMGNFRWVTVSPKEQKNLEIVLFHLKPGGMHDEATIAQLRDLVTKGARTPSAPPEAHRGTRVSWIRRST